MKFEAKPVSINGMSLVARVEGVYISSIVALFPEGKMEGYYDPETGYNHQWEVGFVHESGAEFYVYSRWNTVRIGSRGNDSLARDLAEFLKNSVSLKAP